MSQYQLSPLALADIEEILSYLQLNASEDVAFKVEDELFSAFDRLAINPGLGHRRGDLTRKPCYVHTVEPYLIIYARGADPLPILAVFHAARDVKKLLKSRLKPSIKA